MKKIDIFMFFLLMSDVSYAMTEKDLLKFYSQTTQQKQIEATERQAEIVKLQNDATDLCQKEMQSQQFEINSLEQLLAAQINKTHEKKEKKK